MCLLVQSVESTNCLVPSPHPPAETKWVSCHTYVQYVMIGTPLAGDSSPNMFTSSHTEIFKDIACHTACNGKASYQQVYRGSLNISL